MLRARYCIFLLVGYIDPQNIFSLWNEERSRQMPGHFPPQMPVGMQMAPGAEAIVIKTDDIITLSPLLMVAHVYNLRIS